MQHQPQGTGWYVSRKGERHGPYSWDQLLTHARQGLVRPADKVFSPTTQSWMKASRVPGLLGASGKPLRSSAWLGWSAGIIGFAAVAVAVILFAPVTWPWSAPDLGVATYAPPSGTIAITTEWGPTPTDRVCILLDEGAERSAAESAATALGAQIVGEIELISMYVLQTDGTTEDDLRASLDTAAAQPGVVEAFPEQLAHLAATSRMGVRCEEGGALDDAAYEGARGTPHTMIGAQSAWDLLDANAADLGKVQVGITDDGLYHTGEFDSGAVTIKTRLEEDTLAAPLDDNGTPDPMSSHGTGVASVMVADADDGGLTGLITKLGSKLTVSMTNIYSSEYGGDTDIPYAVADELTHYQDAKGAWRSANIAALIHEIDNGSTIVNCSWGADTADPPSAGEIEAYRRFFSHMASKRKDVLFVVAAGNDSISSIADGALPAGFAMENVVTVGCVDNAGRIGATGTNTAATGFEVTLAAPGEGIPHGIAPDGTVLATNGSTSMAAPQVASVAAMIRSIDGQLTAKQIKEMLANSARTSYGGQAIEAGVGGRLLAADQAVLAAINGKRAREGKAALTMTEALGGLQIQLTAAWQEPPADDPSAGGTWLVTASVPDAGTAGVSLDARFTGVAPLQGALTPTLASGAQAQWTVSDAAEGVFHVRRTDSGACWRVTLGTSDGVDELAAIAGAPTGDAAAGTTGEQQAGDFPAAPVGSMAVTSAVEAAADDVGLSISEWLSAGGEFNDIGRRLYFASMPGYSHVSIVEHSSPELARDNASTEFCGTLEDVPWAFHDLTAYQTDQYWNEPPTPQAQIRWWLQGNFIIRVTYPNSAATQYQEFNEALWRRFGGGTGPGTPTSTPAHILREKALREQQNSEGELPFGTKADIGTVTE